MTEHGVDPDAAAEVEDRLPLPDLRKEEVVADAERPSIASAGDLGELVR